MAVLVAYMPPALLHPPLLQEADTQRSMLRALLLTADPAEVCLLALPVGICRHLTTAIHSRFSRSSTLCWPGRPS